MAINSAAHQLQTPRRVKICGVTQPAQAHEIAALGADFIGLNFWPGSRRFLPLEKAAELRGLPSTTQLVGVFFDADSAYLQEAVQAAGLAMVQLHGRETPDQCAALASKGLRVIKAIQVRDEATLEAIADYAVKDILLDAWHPQAPGGTGEAFPWELALAFKRRYADRSLWLAGGLTPENVALAARGTRPYAVDVASGVEDQTPGVKNLDKVAAFIRAAKEAAPLV